MAVRSRSNPRLPLNTNQETNHATEHFDATDPQS
jgi:hypothetical protein